MADKEFSVIAADTKSFIGKLPFEVPNGIKRVFRNGGWKVLNDNVFDNRAAEEEVVAGFGCGGPVQNRNSLVLDIAEVVK